MSSSAPPERPSAGQITLRYWAAAAQAAGVDSDVIEVAGPVTLAELRATARTLHGAGKFADVLACCSVLVGERPSNGDPADVVVEPGQRVEFLPPFAGG